jgi:hypothetical protein
MPNKIQVGYGSDRREGSTKKGLYGSQRSGKLNHDGGFNRQPTVDYTSISDERWNALDWNDYK